MNVLTKTGVVLNGEDIKIYAERRGLCHLCARTKTHKRTGKLLKIIRNNWQVLTVMNGEGRYTVYKGFCIQPTCYSLEQARERLGESLHERTSIGDDFSESTDLDASFHSSVKGGGRPPIHDRGSTTFTHPTPPRKIKGVRNSRHSPRSDVSTASNTSSFCSDDESDGQPLSPRDAKISMLSSIPQSIQPLSLTTAAPHGLSTLSPPRKLPASAPPAFLEKALSIAAPLSPPVTSILLSLPVEDVALKQRLELFVHDPQEKQLTLTAIELSEIKITPVLTAIRMKKISSGENPLETLVADECKLLGGRLDILLEGLSKLDMCGIQKLSLSANGIERKGAETLSRFLSVCTHLEELNVSNNQIGSDGLALIMDALDNHATKISKLNFARTSTLDLNDSTHVFLSSNHTLTILNLESNFLRDSGVQLICLAVGENESPALEKIYLTNNAFGDGGAFALAKLLESNTSIQVLGIGENAIDNIGAQCMLHALKCNGSIRAIAGLYTNKIADKSIILAIESWLEESIEKTFSDRVLTSREKEHPSFEVGNNQRGHSSLTEISFLVDEDGTDVTSLGGTRQPASNEMWMPQSPPRLFSEGQSLQEIQACGSASDGKTEQQSEKLPASSSSRSTNSATDFPGDFDSESESSQSDDLTLGSLCSEEAVLGPSLESILPLPKLHLATSTAAALVRQSSYREAPDLPMNGQGGLINDGELLYKNEEVKTVCLSATGNGDAGFETIFTLGSCANDLPTLESYEQVNVSDFAVEVEANLSSFEMEKNKTLEQEYVSESDDESYAFESEINGPIYTPRAALEAEDEKSIAQTWGPVQPGAVEREPSLAKVAALAPKPSASTPTNTVDSLTLFQSAPLSHVDHITNQRHYFPLLDFEYEARVLKQSLKDAERIGARIGLEFEIATTDRLSAFFAQGGRRVMHLSCHGHPDYLALENGFGDMQALPVVDLRRFISAGGDSLDFVFVSACHSRSAGDAFLQAGVPHVVCCKQDAMFRDEGAAEFARNFYRALACNRTLKQAFNMAREAVRVSPVVKDSELESDKYLLLPEKADSDSYHDVNVFFADHACVRNQAGTLQNPPRILQRVPQNFVGRESDMYKILEALRCSDWIQVEGARGSGKASVVAAVTRYVQQRQTSFLFDDTLWLPAPEEYVDNGDTLYAHMSKLVSMLVHSNSNSRATNAYKECWGRVLREMHGKRTFLVVDARRCATQAAYRNLEQFVSDLLQVANVKIITIISNSGIKSRVPSRTISIGPLDFETSAFLFARLVHSARFSAPELASILAPKSTPSPVNYPSRRRSLVFEKIGRGLPANIEQAAMQMSETDLMELIRLAKRPDSQPSTRGQLEEEIQKKLFEESLALRKSHFLRARDMRDCIEELQILRTHLPTLLTSSKPRKLLFSMVSTRRSPHGVMTWQMVSRHVSPSWKSKFKKKKSGRTHGKISLQSSLSGQVR